MLIDELGSAVTAERIQELLGHFMVRSDAASRDVCLVIEALQADNVRLRGAIGSALEDLDRRDEIGAVDGLRAALYRPGGESV